MKRRHLEFEISFFSYLLTAIFSGMLAIIILFWAGRLTAEFFSHNLFLSVMLPLILAGFATTVFMLHKTDYHFQKMSAFRCAARAFRETGLFGCILAALLVLEKNGVTESRLWFITTLALNFLAMTLESAYISAFLLEAFQKSPDASLICVVTNSSRAQKAMHALRGDWARRIVGVCLVDGGNPADIENLGDIIFLATPETLLERIQREWASASTSTSRRFRSLSGRRPSCGRRKMAPYPLVQVWFRRQAMLERIQRIRNLRIL